METLCKTCRNHMNPWSESLREEYDGCCLLMLGKAQGGIEESEIFDYIDVDQVSLGWVTNGHMATNDQLLLKDVKDCKKYYRY